VVIDKNGQARLADFGLLTFVSDPSNPTGSSSVTNSGTTRWMGPELLHPELFGFQQCRPTKKSDCYALGMVILEVLSGEPPFPRDKEFIVMRKVIEGERPERPSGVGFTDDLWGTLEQCWLPKPDDRPTIEAVLEHLGQVSNNSQPLPPTSKDVETDGDNSVSTTSRSRLLHFAPNSLPTTKKDTSEVVSDPPVLNKQVGFVIPGDPTPFIPHYYNLCGAPWYCGGYSELWMSEHQNRKVAVKVLKIHSNLEDVKSVGHSLNFPIVDFEVFIQLRRGSTRK
jgi:serine/threonine protein kinase